MKKFIRLMWQTTLGRALTLATLVIIVAYGSKLYYVEKEQAQSDGGATAASARITTMADTLDELLAPSPDEALAQFPERSEWFPRTIACGTTSSAPAPGSESIWDMLGLEQGQPMRFQYLFERVDDGYALVARRDADCDGLFYVVRLDVRPRLTGGFSRAETTQNAGE